MRSKQIITIVLLVFVAASVAHLAVKTLRTSPPSPEQVAAGPRADAPKKGRHIQAYYFHRSVRCTTCNTIEKWAREVVRTDFADAVGKGTLGWKTVNFEQPENQAYRTELKVHTQSVVLVEFVDGKVKDWEPLPDVWTLVDDEPRFREYVRGEVAARLKG